MSLSISMRSSSILAYSAWIRSISSWRMRSNLASSASLLCSSSSWRCYSILASSASLVSSASTALYLCSSSCISLASSWAWICCSILLKLSISCCYSWRFSAIPSIKRWLGWSPALVARISFLTPISGLSCYWIGSIFINLIPKPPTLLPLL